MGQDVRRTEAQDFSCPFYFTVLRLEPTQCACHMHLIKESNLIASTEFEVLQLRQRDRQQGGLNPDGTSNVGP